nr:hypothetical protein Iba_chr02eCG6780 [Ipomoea batatas]
MAARHEASLPPRSSLSAAKLQAFSSGRLREAVSRAIPMEAASVLGGGVAGGSSPIDALVFLHDRTATQEAAFSEFRVSSDGGLQRHPFPPAVQGDG